MTSPGETNEPGTERGVGGGQKRVKAPQPATSTRNGLLAVGAVGALAVVLATTALLVALGRPSSSAVGSSPSPVTSCRSIAWSAMPTGDTLPDGWSVSGSGFYTDGFGAQFSGPVPSGSQTSPVLNVRVSCYGSDAHVALIRSHQADLAAGGKDIAIADLGDESVATQDASGTTTSVYIRNGDLLASIAAQGVTPDDLDQAAGAIDDAMSTAGEAAAAGPQTEPSPSDEGAVPSDEAVTDPPPTHTFPELEAKLPASIDGTTFTRASTTATDVMAGDPSADALFAWLTANGKTSDQLEFATSYDPTQTVDAGLTAIRAAGIAPAKLREELIATWLEGNSSGATTSTKTIGGKPVTVVDYHDEGSMDYLFDLGDAVVIFSSSDPALVATTISGMK